MELILIESPASVHFKVPAPHLVENASILWNKRGPETLRIWGKILLEILTRPGNRINLEVIMVPVAEF